MNSQCDEEGEVPRHIAHQLGPSIFERHPSQPAGRVGAGEDAIRSPEGADPEASRQVESENFQCNEGLNRKR